MATAIIGSVFVDIKGFSWNAYEPTGTNIGEVAMMHGGVCRNVCEDFANQGGDPLFISMVDHSAFGSEIRDHLRALNVDTRHVISAPRGMGVWLAILDDRGELVGSVSQQPDFLALEDYLREHGEDLIRTCDSVVLEIDSNEEIAELALTQAEKFHVPVYAIVGNMGVILRRPDFLRRVACFICNEIEASRLFGRDLKHLTPDEMQRDLPALAQAWGIGQIVVTMGPDGAVWMDAEGETGCCPAEEAEMVESTGAGDAFFAATVMALTRGYPLPKAVKCGSRLAAHTIACTEASCPKVEGLFDL